MDKHLRTLLLLPLVGMLFWGRTPVESGETARNATPSLSADAATAPVPEPESASTDVAESPAPDARLMLASATGPVLEASSFEYDFGEADSSTSVKHDFVIRNAGTEPLILGKPTTTCGCTVANLGDSTLEPGEETRISATMSLVGRQGLTAKSIHVTSNDPKHNPAQFTIKGIAVAPIMMEPKMISFGTIEDDDTHYASMTLKATKEDIHFDIVEVDHNMPGFKVEVEPIVPRKEFKITLFNPEPLEPRSYYGRFSIRTDNPAHTNLAFTASATVVGELKIQPEKMTLLASTEPGKKTDIAFRVDPGRTKEFELLDVVPPLEGVEVEIVPLGQRNSYLVKLKGLPQDMSLHGKAAIIKTNLPDRPEIEVPFEIRQMTAVNQPAAPTTPLVVRPAQITLIENTTQADARSTALFIVTSGTTRDFEITEVVPPVEGVRTEIKKERDNYYLVRLEGLPQDTEINGKSVVVKTNGPQVSVPIFVRPNPAAVRTVRAMPPAAVRPATPE
jgi:hypothetical protein